MTSTTTPEFKWKDVDRALNIKQIVQDTKRSLEKFVEEMGKHEKKDEKWGNTLSKAKVNEVLLPDVADLDKASPMKIKKVTRDGRSDSHAYVHEAPFEVVIEGSKLGHVNKVNFISQKHEEDKQCALQVQILKVQETKIFVKVDPGKDDSGNTPILGPYHVSVIALDGFSAGKEKAFTLDPSPAAVRLTPNGEEGLENIRAIIAPQFTNDLAAMKAICPAATASSAELLKSDINLTITLITDGDFIDRFIVALGKFSVGVDDFRNDAAVKKATWPALNQLIAATQQLRAAGNKERIHLLDDHCVLTGMAVSFAAIISKIQPNIQDALFRIMAGNYGMASSGSVIDAFKKKEYAEVQKFFTATEAGRLKSAPESLNAVMSEIRIAFNEVHEILTKANGVIELAKKVDAEVPIMLK